MAPRPGGVGEFTQPRAHSFAHSCKVATYDVHPRVPFPGRLGPVLEDVSEVRAAVSAHDLSPDQVGIRHDSQQVRADCK